MSGRCPWATDHARDRAVERLGFSPDLEHWRRAALDIMDTVHGRPRAMLVKRDRDCEVWCVHIGSVQSRVVWSPVSATIVTVLP